MAFAVSYQGRVRLGVHVGSENLPTTRWDVLRTAALNDAAGRPLRVGAVELVGVRSTGERVALRTDADVDRFLKQNRRGGDLSQKSESGRLGEIHRSSRDDEIRRASFLDSEGTPLIEVLPPRFTNPEEEDNDPAASQGGKAATAFAASWQQPGGRSWPSAPLSSGPLRPRSAPPGKGGQQHGGRRCVVAASVQEQHSKEAAKGATSGLEEENVCDARVGICVDTEWRERSELAFEIREELARLAEVVSTQRVAVQRLLRPRCRAAGHDVLGLDERNVDAMMEDRLAIPSLTGFQEHCTVNDPIRGVGAGWLGSAVVAPAFASAIPGPQSQPPDRGRNPQTDVTTHRWWSHGL